MAVSYLNSYSLNLNAQKAYQPAMSSSGSVLNGCSQRGGLVFGMEVQQTAPNNYLSTSNPYGESFHNPFSDYRFPKVLVRVLYHQEPGQSEQFKAGIKGLSAVSMGFRELGQPKAGSFKTDAGQKRHFSSTNPTGSNDERSLKRLRHGEDSLMPTLRSEPSGLSNIIRSQQGDENILYTSQSELRIDRVWSMAVKANSRLPSIDANHSPLDSTLKDSAGNGSSDAGRSTPQISSVVDNNLHQPVYIPDQDHMDTFSKPEAPIAIITPQLNSKQLQQNTSSKNEFDFNASVSGESLTNFPDKASQKACERFEKRKAYRKTYEESPKGKASRKAYNQSEARKASHKAYERSAKGKASRKTYRQSDKAKASRKAYQQSGKWKVSRASNKAKASRRAYQKAYHKALKNTGDKEQAKIAGKQASAFIRESIKAKNSELEKKQVSGLES